MTVENWYTQHYDEDARLEGFSVEWLRTTELVSRVLPAAPARVADIAGGTGRYASWLAGQGYRVDMLDLVPLHVEVARQRTAGQDVECVVGDARALPWADETFDAAMIMGALYHLQERDDRLACLAEARRVLKPGGVLVTEHIGRWASLFDGYRRGMAADPDFRRIVDADLATGCHNNPTEHPNWFTTAYFHRPDEVQDEVAAAGFTDVKVLAVDGFASDEQMPVELQSGDGLDDLLRHLRETESEPFLMGASSHLMSLSRKP